MLICDALKRSRFSCATDLRSGNTLIALLLGELVCRAVAGIGQSNLRACLNGGLREPIDGLRIDGFRFLTRAALLSKIGTFEVMVYPRSYGASREPCWTRVAPTSSTLINRVLRVSLRLRRSSSMRMRFSCKSSRFCRQ